MKKKTEQVKSAIDYLTPEQTEMIDDAIAELQALASDIERANNCGVDVSECEQARRDILKRLRAYKRFFGTTKSPMNDSQEDKSDD